MKPRNGILIVDDTLPTLKLLASTLADEGYTIRPVPSGEEALASVQFELPELILLDIRMPGIDGFEVCQRLKSNPATRDIPTLFLSAATDSQECVKGFELGAVDFIPKPFQKKELLARIRTHIELSRLKFHLEEQVAARTEALTKRTKELCASEEKFSKAFQCSPLAMTISSLDDDLYLDVNKAFETYTGYARHEVIGRSVYDSSIWVDPASREWVIEKLKTDGAIRGFELRFQSKEGELHAGRMSAEIVEFAGRPCVLSVCEDVTEHVRLEEQLRQAQKMESIGQLASGVAHDFNNILAAMQMNLEMLLTEPGLPSSAIADLQELGREVERAAGLTRQLLLFSRHKQPVSKPTNLDQLIRDLQPMLKCLMRAGIQLEITSDNAPHTVFADSGMIEQVVMNLCVNARDAMPKGGCVTLNLALDQIAGLGNHANPAVREGSFVRLSVADKGHGIEKAVLKRIFEPFFTTKPPGEGTGLGLPTVLGIVKQHQGWVDVESIVGKGSAFHVFLPALSTVTQSSAQAAAMAIQCGTETILMVGGAAPLGAQIALTLRKLGYGVLEAEDATQALEVWVEHRNDIDLLLADAELLDGSSGFDLPKRLRVDKNKLPVVFLVEYNSSMFDSDAFASQSITCIPRLCDAADLAQAVRSCLDRMSNNQPR